VAGQDDGARGAAQRARQPGELAERARRSELVDGVHDGTERERSGAHDQQADARRPAELGAGSGDRHGDSVR
jgi:hypothetical protein